MKKLGIPAPTFADVQKRDGIADTLVDGFFDAEGSLVKRHGFSLFKDFSSTNHFIQGIYESPVSPYYVYVVYNNLLRRVTSGGTPTTITGTTLTADGTQATFAHDGSFMYVANNSSINKVDEGAGTATVLSGGTAPANVTHVAWLQGYLLANGLQSGGVAGDTNFSTDHGATWELFNNESHPDSSTALFVGWDEVVAFGGYSVESSFNDGVTPWAVIQGAKLNWGLLAPYSPVFMTMPETGDAAFMFLSVMDNAVRFIRMNARIPQDLSQRYESVIHGLTDAANAKAWGITYRGTPLYVCTFPADDFTLVYNLRRNEWYQWGTWGGSTYAKWVTNSYAYIRGWNKHLIGHHTNAFVYYLDDSLLDSATAIRMKFTSASISHGSARAKRQNRLDFRVKRGQATDGSEPTFSVGVSDNGKTRKTARTVSLGLANDLDFYTGSLIQGGRYRSKSYQIIHADTKSDFIMADMEESFDWLNN